MKHYEFYDDLADQIHVMIGGASGHGKSVIESGIIYNLAQNYTPDEVEMWFIDPKQTELVRYEWLPHVAHYADNDRDALILLDLLIYEMDRRNKEMQAMIRQGCQAKLYPGKAIYCFVDETADVIERQGKEAVHKFQIIIQMARSANIHMIFCSQSVNSKLIPTATKGNISCTIGVYIPKNWKYMSRVLTGNDDCCHLPKWGKCVYITPDDYEVRDVPMYTNEDWNELRKTTLLRRVI